MRRWALIGALLGALALPATTDASLVYRNSVSLKPGQYARFVVDPRGKGFHSVVLTDKRSGSWSRRWVSKRQPNAFMRLSVPVSARIRFRDHIRIRVDNRSNHARRIRVAVRRQ